MVVVFYIAFVLIVCLCEESKGHPSGLDEMFGYILTFLCVILFISGVALIITYPIILLVIIGAVILFCIIVSIIPKSNKKPQPINNSQNNTNSQQPPMATMTEFQKQLNNSIRIEEQTQTKTYDKEKDKILSRAQNDYNNIKDKLITQVKAGKYHNDNGQKYVIIHYELRYSLIPICVEAYEHRVGVTPSIFNPNPKKHTELNFKIVNKYLYDLYTTELQHLLEQDKIECKIIVCYIYEAHKEFSITDTIKYGTFPSYSIYAKCKAYF